MGKSSDTPKEVKNRKTGRNTIGIREARVYGAGCIYIQIRLPGYMEIRCDHCATWFSYEIGEISRGFCCKDCN